MVKQKLAGATEGTCDMLRLVTVLFSAEEMLIFGMSAFMTGLALGYTLGKLV